MNVDESTPDGRARLAKFREWLSTATPEDMEKRFGPPGKDGGWTIKMQPDQVTGPTDDEIIAYYLTAEEKAVLNKVIRMRRALARLRELGNDSTAAALQLLAAACGKDKPKETD